LAPLLGADLVGARQRSFEGRFDLWSAGNLAADVTDDAAEPDAQQTKNPIAKRVSIPGRPLSL
jgi:hypothetical protein